MFLFEKETTGSKYRRTDSKFRLKQIEGLKAKFPPNVARESCGFLKRKGGVLVSRRQHGKSEKAHGKKRVPAIAVGKIFLETKKGIERRNIGNGV